MIDDGSFDETNSLHRSVLLFCFSFYFIITYLPAIIMLRISLALFAEFFLYCFISEVMQIKLWEQNKIFALL